MKQKVIMFILALSILLNLSIPAFANVEEGYALRIATAYSTGMPSSYADGYVPSVRGGQARETIPCVLRIAWLGLRPYVRFF